MFASKTSRVGSLGERVFVFKWLCKCNCRGRVIVNVFINQRLVHGWKWIAAVMAMLRVDSRITGTHASFTLGSCWRFNCGRGSNDMTAVQQISKQTNNAVTAVEIKSNEGLLLGGHSHGLSPVSAIASFDVVKKKSIFVLLSHHFGKEMMRGLV